MKLCDRAILRSVLAAERSFELVAGACLQCLMLRCSVAHAGLAFCQPCTLLLLRPQTVLGRVPL